MVIDEVLLQKLEKLSSFKIAQDKREDFKKELQEFVNFAEILNELDLKDLDDNYENCNTPFRLDEPKKSDVIDIILKHAPCSEDRYFVVPKIIE